MDFFHTSYFWWLSFELWYIYKNREKFCKNSFGQSLGLWTEMLCTFCIKNPSKTFRNIFRALSQIPLWTNNNVHLIFLLVYRKFYVKMCIWYSKGNTILVYFTWKFSLIRREFYIKCNTLEHCYRYKSVTIYTVLVSLKLGTLFKLLNSQILIFSSRWVMFKK